MNDPLNPLYGRQIFFLYPASVMQKDLINEIFRQEYEVYILKDHRKAKLLLKRYNNAILYINIDTELTEQEWLWYAQSIINSPELQEIRVGVLTYNENPALARKYLLELGIQAGFVRLKLGIQQSQNIILKVLQANEARGQRRYVRAKCQSKKEASFNIKLGNSLYQGQILDISSVGMAVTFDDAPNLNSKQLLKDIQLRIKGSLCLVSGIIAGIRKADQDIYVILFDKSVSSTTREKIKDLIYKCLQSRIEQEISEIN